MVGGGLAIRYFLDTEFIEDGRTIDLLSIGIVAEDGREYYAEFARAPVHKAGEWVRANVLPHLCKCLTGFVESVTEEHWSGGTCPVRDRKQIALDLYAFTRREHHGKPEFWGYYADYDWVALCQLFGTMLDLPKGWPRYCRDIKQWCDELGNPRLPEQGKGEHHALADARWNRLAWGFLSDYRP